MARAPEREEAHRRSDATNGRSPGATGAVLRRLQTLGPPNSIVLLAARAEADLVDLGTRPVWPFPQAREGGWAGYEPVDGPAAITHLEAQRTRGAHHFVLPSAVFSWRHRFPELFDHLEATCLRVHQDEHMVIWDIRLDPAEGLRLDPTPAARVRVLGTYAAHRAGPPPDLVRELAQSEDLVVEQTWRTDAEAAVEDDPADADYRGPRSRRRHPPGRLPQHADRHARDAGHRPGAAHARRRSDRRSSDHRTSRRNRGP